MRKINYLMGIFLIIISLNLVSSQIIINQQPNEIYNKGETINLPITIMTSSGISDFLYMDIICNNLEQNFYISPINLMMGEQKKIDSLLPLTKGFIKDLKGNCVIKIRISDNYALTNEFEISDSLIINSDLKQENFSPGESIIIEGNVIKSSGKNANGFIDISIIDNEKVLFNQIGILKNNFYSVNFNIPEDTKSGNLLLKINAYETDMIGEKTNNGFFEKQINIKQIPKNIELIVEPKTIIPGNNVKIKTILYDQSGEKMHSLARISLINREGKMVDQIETQTNEFLEYYIKENELPGKWKIIASSDRFTSETFFSILEKESIKIEILNKTLTITNNGNIPYNKTAQVKIGEKFIELDLYLNVNENKRYLLTAPDGDYDIEITTEKETFSESVMLTGKTIDVKNISEKSKDSSQKIIVWIFILVVLLIISLIIFKKGYQKTFIGYISSRVSRKNHLKKSIESKTKETSLFDSKNKAELSLSIRGEKQDSSLICLNLKNFKEIKSGEGNIKETFKKISEFSDSRKAIIYENNNIILFIISPKLTKTFKNQKTTLEIAQKIKETINGHNKIFKQKIDFGISIDSGDTIITQEKDSFKFTCLGNFVTNLKKMSLLSKQEIYMGEKINSLFKEYVKTIKHNKENIDYYTIKELKNPEEYKKFINNFLKKLEKEK